MFIISGTKGYVKDHGDTILQGQCPNCGNHVTMRGMEYGSRFTFFWIPLFKLSVERYALCPICEHGKELKKADFVRQLACNNQLVIEGESDTIKENVLDAPSDPY